MPPRPVDRRTGSREALFLGRRRYPRLKVRADAFYMSRKANVFAGEIDLSLRGMFLPCRFPDMAGNRGTVHVDLGEGHLVKMEVKVLRVLDEEQSGMAMRVVSMSQEDRTRFATWLLRKGGLQMLPQLDRKYETMTRRLRPLEAQRVAAAVV